MFLVKQKTGQVQGVASIFSYFMLIFHKSATYLPWVKVCGNEERNKQTEATVNVKKMWLAFRRRVQPFFCLGFFRVEFTV